MYYKPFFVCYHKRLTYLFTLSTLLLSSVNSCVNNEPLTHVWFNFYNPPF